MKLEIAGEQHSAELVEFFKKFPLRGPVEIRVDRGQDFFKPYEIQSEEHITYTLRGRKEELLGVATFVIGQSSILGKPARVAVGRDLRILETRDAVLGWSQHFLPVMEEISRVFKTEAVTSVMNLNEVKAMNAFVRPRPGKRPLPRYHQFRRFNLISLHGFFPWAPEPLSSIKIRRGSEKTANALVSYLARKTAERDFTFLTSEEAIRSTILRWGLKWDDFLLAQNSIDDIVGCCAPWNPGAIEEYIPLKYNLLGHNFRQFLKFGRTFGWTRKLTKPVHRLNQEAPLEFRYLSFLFAENPDIFESLARIAFEEARDNEFLVYTQMRTDIHLRRPRTWISARMPYAQYILMPPDQATPDFLHPSNSRPSFIEPFFT